MNPMYRLAVFFVITLSPILFAADKTPDPDVLRAVKDVKILRGLMRNPDSFVLERVYTVVRDKTGGLCFEYRSQNGFGGMNRAVAYFGKAQHTSIPAIEGAPALELSHDDPYLPALAHDVCEDVPVLRDLTKDTLAAIESQKNKTDHP